MTASDLTLALILAAVIGVPVLAVLLMYPDDDDRYGDKDKYKDGMP